MPSRGRSALVECLQALRPAGIPGLAREVRRDAKQGHDDVHLPREHGLVARTAEAAIHVVRQVIRADFVICAAARSRRDRVPRPRAAQPVPAHGPGSAAAGLADALLVLREE
jgi:hypothetical protein